MSTGVIKDRQTLSGILNLPVNVNVPVPTAVAMVVNAIDTTETQTVSGVATGTIVQRDYRWYNYQDTAANVNYMIKSGRSNYAINGEPAELITIPAMETNSGGDTVNYPETTGLESASWKMAYFPYDTYSGLIWYCKDRNIYDSGNYQLDMTVTYDEEAEVTTTTLDTPLADILTAIGEGKDVICKWNDLTLRLAQYTTDSSVDFTTVYFVDNASYIARIYYSFAKVVTQKRNFTSMIKEGTSV